METSNQPAQTNSLEQTPASGGMPVAVTKPSSLISPTNLVFLILLGIISYLLIQNRQLNQLPKISSYEECLNAAGSLLQESYPATCVTKLGESFTELNTQTTPPEWLPEPGLEPEALPENFQPSSFEDGTTRIIDTEISDSKYTSTRVVSFHSPFSLTYPEGWQIKSEAKTSSNDDGSLNLSLTKSGAKITIQQGAMGGGGCLYPEDKIEDGMFSKYGEYSELKKGNLRWRVAPIVGSKPLTYGVCEYNPESKHFASLTKIGSIFLNLAPTNETFIAEFNQIIESLIILP